MTRSLSFEELFNKDVDEQIQTVVDGLLNGNATSYDQYKHMVGQYRGLCVAKNIFNDRIKDAYNQGEEA
jgi:hypothetical protein